jgi:hypothetical protein
MSHESVWKGLPFVRLVDADIGIVQSEDEILHVAQHVALAVLRPRAAEMGAETKEGGCRLAHGPALDRQATQQQEATAV